MKYILFAFLIFVASVTAAQNIGIGTLTPAEKLDIAGNLRADTAKLHNLKLAPNAGIGKVLTSDAAGNASWQINTLNFKVLNGISKRSDTLLLGGRLIENTSFNLSGKNV